MAQGAGPRAQGKQRCCEAEMQKKSESVTYRTKASNHRYLV
jgi:hypothetical protein